MIPTSQSLERANQIIAQIESLRAELLALLGGSAPAPARAATRTAAPAAAAASAASGKQARNMSAEGRARIAAAARARWAKYRAAKKKASKA